MWVEIPCCQQYEGEQGVTPLAGVWVEIICGASLGYNQTSLPLRECGLKSYIIITFQCHIVVTPLAGVWVEISVIGLSFGNERVTPLAGVWVEMSSPVITERMRLVTPLAGVWVEISIGVMQMAKGK